MGKELKLTSKQLFDTINQTPTESEIQLGCLQRIADATELMAKDREKLIRDYDYMRNNRDAYRTRYETEAHRNRALKGVITKLKNKLKS